jgi:hypothetical protein
MAKVVTLSLHTVNCIALIEILSVPFTTISLFSWEKPNVFNVFTDRENKILKNSHRRTLAKKPHIHTLTYTHTHSDTLSHIHTHTHTRTDTVA